MAYTALNLGYKPQAGYEYDGTTDSSADWGSVPNETYFYDKTLKQVYYKDNVGAVYGAYVGGTAGVTQTYNVSSTQWNNTLAAPVTLGTGLIANGLTFFTDANKSNPSVNSATLGSVVGTGYVTATNVPTTGGSGTGLTFDIVAVGGNITSITINQKGSLYTDGDIVTIVQGGGASDDEIATLTVYNAGTTPYDEYDIQFDRSVILWTGATGGTPVPTGGTATLTIGGTAYTMTWNTDNYTTIQDFLATNQAAIEAAGFIIYQMGDGTVPTDGRIRIGSTTNSEADLNAITFVNTSGDLNGDVRSEFDNNTTEGSNANALGTHLRIPYAGKPYFGKRILHTLRVNFNLSTGSVQYAELGLFRWQNDSQIGSAIQVIRNPDITGTLAVIETYTASPTDSFVTGGFYVALVNNTGQTLTFENNAGLLVQNIFESPISF